MGFDQTLNRLVEVTKSAESAQIKALLLDTTITMIPSIGTAGSTTVFDGYLSTLLLAGMQGNTLDDGDFPSYANTTGACTAEYTRPLVKSLVNQETHLFNTSLVVDPDPDDLELSVSDR